MLDWIIPLTFRIGGGARPPRPPRGAAYGFPSRALSFQPVIPVSVFVGSLSPTCAPPHDKTGYFEYRLCSERWRNVRPPADSITVAH